MGKCPPDYLEFEDPGNLPTGVLRETRYDRSIDSGDSDGDGGKLFDEKTLARMMGLGSKKIATRAKPWQDQYRTS